MSSVRRPPSAPESSTGAAVVPLHPADAAALVVARQRAEIERLRELVSQLELALESRVAIEQAKGILSVRLDCSVEQAFEVLRRGARSNRVRLHDLAAEVVAGRAVPPRLASAPNGNGSRRP